MENSLIGFFTSVVIALFSALLGGYFGAWFQYYFQNKKVYRVRKIAITALDIFCRYAKQGQTFDMVASEFNNSLDVVEKRAVLVALCKLGIPVVKPVDNRFDIKSVKFKHELIDKETISLMKGQVDKGNCDELFFSDVDVYFSSDTRLFSLRALAKKYVDVVLSKSECDMNNKKITYPKDAFSQFTPGELNVLNVFCIRACYMDYFDEKGKAILKRMEELKKEIDLGFWDIYLFWDGESFQNMRNQNIFTVAFTKMINTNTGEQHITK